MNKIAKYVKPVSWVSLLLIVVPPVLFYIDAIGAGLMGQLLLTGTIIWFGTASLWMKHE